MAANKFMDITMASSFFLLLLLVPASGARYVSGGAIETQAGIMPMDGVSPVPTEAPGLNGVPKELRRRFQTFVSSPPSNWCGMIDGDYQNILSCPPNASCMLKSNFYNVCGCTSVDTDLCFDYVLQTACIDYDVFEQAIVVGSLTAACSNPYKPFCLTMTSSGLGKIFGCDTTSFPRTHSFVPVAAWYYSATSATTIPYYTPNPNSNSTGKKKSKLPSSAKAGIGTGVGLITLAVIAAIAFCLRQKRKQAHVSPTDGGAGPVMAQTKNMPQGYQNAAQPVQQQYQPQPQGYQGAAQPVQQQYQPQPIQQYQPQLDNTKFPNSADIPPYSPAPVYTSDSQQISAAPIPPNEPRSDTKIANQYPSSTGRPAPPPSTNPSHQTYQQHQNTAPSWDYPPNNPIPTIGQGRSDLHHQDIPRSHSELGVGGAGVNPHTGTPWNHSELRAGVHHPSPPQNYSELPGAGEARVQYPGRPTNNHSELGQ